MKQRYAVANGSAAPESLAPVEEEAIREAVKLQQDLNIQTITNGEYSRHMVSQITV